MSIDPCTGFDEQIIDLCRLVGSTSGYHSTVTSNLDLPDLTTDDYAELQLQLNEKKALDFVLPLIRQLGAQRILDVGCGVGKMVTTLADEGYDAYGIDLSGLQNRWQQQQLSTAHFFVVGPEELRLPFRDGALDFAFSLGVIEHVGTTNGHSDRRPDFHAVRKKWIQEIFRTIMPGGHLLLAGPNKCFPVDVAHGLDSRATLIERVLSEWSGVSIHKTWGDNFLWCYADFDRYLAGQAYTLTPLSVASYLHHSRVPGPLRSLVKAYVDHLPKFLLATGFNPWTAVLIRKTPLGNT